MKRCTSIVHPYIYVVAKIERQTYYVKIHTKIINFRCKYAGRQYTWNLLFSYEFFLDWFCFPTFDIKQMYRWTMDVHRFIIFRNLWAGCLEGFSLLQRERGLHFFPCKHTAAWLHLHSTLAQGIGCLLLEACVGKRLNNGRCC